VSHEVITQRVSPVIF